MIDKDDANIHPAAVVMDAARTVLELRAEGKTVLLHCVHAHSRTPITAAAYWSLVTGDDFRTCLRRVQEVLPSGRNPRRSIVREPVRLETV